jgi:anti-anti-sigma factor
MSLLRIAVGERDGRPAIALAGELDLAEVPLAQTAIEGALASHPRLVIDLSGLEFIDLAGAVLLTGLASRDHGCEVTVLGTFAPAVERLLALTGLGPARVASCY